MYNFKLKTFVSEENLLKYVSDYDIFKYYIGDFKVGKAFNSPFRDDAHASFNIGYSPITNRLYYNDYILGGGNTIMFVMYKYNLSYKEACNKIIIDLGLEEHFNLFTINKVIPKENKQFIKSNNEEIKKFKEEITLTAKIRPWEDYDLEYWSSYGVSKTTLDKYFVKPVSYSMIGDKIFKLDRYAYVFVEYKDDEKTLTIYQPYSNKQKWTKNHNSSVWYGWTQLPKKGDILIITKSRKDIMSIFEQTGIPATGLQNEKIIPKEHVLNELKDRFHAIYVLYDNDFDKPVNWGRQFGDKFAKECDLMQIEIPDEYQSKDFSDLVENHGVEVAKKVLFELLEPSLPF